MNIIKFSMNIVKFCAKISILRFLFVGWLTVGSSTEAKFSSQLHFKIVLATNKKLFKSTSLEDHDTWP